MTLEQPFTCYGIKVNVFLYINTSLNVKRSCGVVIVNSCLPIYKPYLLYAHSASSQHLQKNGRLRGVVARYSVVYGTGLKSG